MIVVDASAILELLLPGTPSQTLQQRLLDETELMCAPHLIDLEVAQVLRRYAAAGKIDQQRGERALRNYLDLRLIRYPHHILLLRIWDLKQNINAYDAAYIALAELVKATLVTCDSKLGSVPGHHAVVEVW